MRGEVTELGGSEKMIRRTFRVALHPRSPSVTLREHPVHLCHLGVEQHVAEFPGVPVCDAQQPLDADSLVALDTLAPQVALSEK